MTMTPDAMLSFKRQYVADSLMRAAPLEVTVTNPGGSSGGLTNTELRASPVPISGTVSVGTVPVTGTFWQATQPVSIASMPSTPVTGTFWPATQPVSGTVAVSGSVAVTGSFYQATQPVSIASMPSTPVTGTFWQATQPVSGTVSINGTVPVSGTFWQTIQPVSGTFWQATQPVSIAATVAVRNLKDAGRSSLAMTAEFTFAQTAETLLTMTFSADGAATSTFSSRVVTSGKTMRFQQVMIELESLGSGTAPQRAYLRLRRNNSGATTASSPLQSVWSCVNSTAVVKSGNQVAFDIPDGLEIVGDGTKTFGFTLETPDWVATTATGRAKITVIGFEY
jgi:hypothetical protein